MQADISGIVLFLGLLFIAAAFTSFTAIASYNYSLNNNIYIYNDSISALYDFLNTTSPEIIKLRHYGYTLIILVSRSKIGNPAWANILLKENCYQDVWQNDTLDRVLDEIYSQLEDNNVSMCSLIYCPFKHLLFIGINLAHNNNSISAIDAIKKLVKLGYKVVLYPCNSGIKKYRGRELGDIIVYINKKLPEIDKVFQELFPEANLVYVREHVHIGDSKNEYIREEYMFAIDKFTGHLILFVNTSLVREDSIDKSTVLALGRKLAEALNKTNFKFHHVEVVVGYSSSIDVWGRLDVKQVAIPVKVENISTPSLSEKSSALNNTVHVTSSSMSASSISVNKCNTSKSVVVFATGKGYSNINSRLILILVIPLLVLSLSILLLRHR
ncbi:hypothetical protein PYJP_18250 [Pyrofollis japonicus]|uniref:hypothetical protein n=1 Tax=Pyrofollis japonicus TaxID=3060460 RepID=UPI00295A8F8E|nr:hypothetical protein [Pyrofollis japonicus]BEP18473.1 hypothetical protein PYJP_18250 [Pyrofollis japonicus]